MGVGFINHWISAQKYGGPPGGGCGMKFKALNVVAAIKTIELPDPVFDLDALVSSLAKTLKETIDKSKDYKVEVQWIENKGRWQIVYIDIRPWNSIDHSEAIIPWKEKRIKAAIAKVVGRPFRMELGTRGTFYKKHGDDMFHFKAAMKLIVLRG